MENRLSIVFLCFIGFFVIAQSLSAKPEDLKKYEKCYTYASCNSDEKGLENIDKCLKMMRPQEVKSLYQDIRDYTKLKSSNIYDGMAEFCEIDDAAKPRVYTNALKGHKLYKKENCDDESNKGACTRFSETLTMLPLLERAAELHSDTGGLSVSRSAVLNITSMTGSCTLTGVVFTRDLVMPPYKISKAALNMATRVIAANVKAKGILVIMMCPGWVKTNMGTEKAVLEPEESIWSMINTLPKLNEEHHGTFIDRKGNTYPY